jgi:oxygen-independent coproporphyrinogen-3 oxidase
MRFSTTDGEVEFLSGREAWAEDLMLGMRLTRGIEARLLDGEPEVRDDLVGRGLVELVDGRLVPTHDGWLLGNELFGALWDLAGE